METQTSQTRNQAEPEFLQCRREYEIGIEVKSPYDYHTYKIFDMTSPKSVVLVRARKGIGAVVETFDCTGEKTKNPTHLTVLKSNPIYSQYVKFLEGKS